MTKSKFAKILILVSSFFLVFLLVLNFSLSTKNSKSLENLNDSSFTILKLKNTNKVLNLEVARSPQKHEQGLMFRTKLEDNTGMIFIFDTVSNETFWMKNTLIPLDIIYLDSDLKVVSFYKNTKTNQTQEVYPSGSPCKYVIETNANWTIQANLKVGDQFEI